MEERKEEVVKAITFKTHDDDSDTDKRFDAWTDTSTIGFDVSSRTRSESIRLDRDSVRSLRDFLDSWLISSSGETYGDKIKEITHIKNCAHGVVIAVRTVGQDGPITYFCERCKRTIDAEIARQKTVIG